MDAKPHRIAVIENLPNIMQDHALVDWETTAAVLNTCKPTARKILKEAAVPLTQIGERRRLPRWGALRAFLESREAVAA